MDCELLTVGTELVLGLAVDTNAAAAARALAEAGIRVRRLTSVADDAAELKDALAAALERCATVIVSGGLGPTRDDITRPAVAALLGRPLVRDEAILQELQGRYRARGIPDMPAANAVQADVPRGAAVLPNPRGTAPGLWIEDERGHRAILLPGVPKEMLGILEETVIPRLLEAERTGGPADRRTVTRSRTLRTAGVPESALADQLGDYERLLGPNVTLASLPSLAGVDLRLTAWNVAPDEADAALAKAAEALRPRVHEALYGEGDDDLAAVVLHQLEQASATLATAESCTGGLLAARLTAVPGSSRVFRGGVVAYHNDLKLELLGVGADLLAQHGAVSEAVARQMADGAARSLAADAAVAVTGIAGPDGGTAEKPRGTVWIAVRWRDEVRAFTHVLPGGREDVRERTVQWALNYLRRIVAGTL
jgi:nicotinamide-nucleotide amidase